MCYLGEEERGEVTTEGRWLLQGEDAEKEWGEEKDVLTGYEGRAKFLSLKK